MKVHLDNHLVIRRQQAHENELVCDLLTLYRTEGASDATLAKLHELRILRGNLAKRAPRAH